MQMAPYYQLTKDETLNKLKTTTGGLSHTTANDLHKKLGGNLLTEAKQKSKWLLLFSQFTDVMILILLAAAAISFIAGERIDAIVILVIVIANALMGYSQQNNAEKAMRMLQKMSSQQAVVVRDNTPVKIESAQIVPGDILLLEAGNIIAADARLIEVNALKTEESSLTGESITTEKTTAAIKEGGLVPGDQHNMVFKGTIASNGSAKAVVTAIGMDTEIGKIASMLNMAAGKTPLQKRLAVFSKQLSFIVMGICLVVFGMGLLRGEPPFKMFLTALSLAVAALPEALPAVIAIALAQGARRLMKQKALIRSLPSVETLGSVTYICSDKTGTLTQNIMTVEKVQPAKGEEALLTTAMLLNNEVNFLKDGELLGDSTETALIKYALKQGHTTASASTNFPLVKKIPFDAERMRMSTLHKHNNKWILFVKGAPVKINEVLANQHEQTQQNWLELNRTWAAEGLRVLFFAYKVFDSLPDTITSQLEKDLVFLGAAAMIDPPREEVIEAIHQCKTAGIKTVMITGDQPITAKAIAARLGIIDNQQNGVRTGSEMEKLTENAFKQELKNIAVYARVSPAQKLKFVKALQQNGEFVAMTGDGVNDAPSIKQADIGIAMGITGTDVAKEAADMILLNDNFTTIVKAIKEGRRIYENIRKFIQYVLACNLGEILTIFFAPILGFGIPLLPIHILWINLVTDGLPGIALIAEPAEKNIMQHPPRPPKQHLFANGLGIKIILCGISITLSSLFVQWWAIQQGYTLKAQQCMVFLTLCFVQLGNALSVRSYYQSIFTSAFFGNRSMWYVIILTIALMLAIVYVPFLQPVFKTCYLTWAAMKIIIVVNIASLLSLELIKYVLNKKITPRA
jgi:Ca2+-transporting ATPase